MVDSKIAVCPICGSKTYLRIENGSYLLSYPIRVSCLKCHSLIMKKNSAGIEGKKGVLWWQIDDILREKRPSYVILENVDRLIRSPAKQCGRDFSIILRCFYQKGYAVEWRVINAADYG